MKIPRDKKYWDLCASVCFISTVADYTSVNMKETKQLKQIKIVLDDVENLDLKKHSIRNLWKNNKKEFWSCLESILFNSKLYDVFFADAPHGDSNFLTHSITYSQMALAENKPAYLIETNITDNPETLIEKNDEKFLLVSAFLPSENIMFYFKENKWYMLGSKDEKIPIFLPEMYLLYVKVQDTVKENNGYSKKLFIFNDKDNVGIIENLSNSLMEYYPHQIIECQERDIERLTNENKTLQEQLDETTEKLCEIEKLNSKILEQNKQLNNNSKSEKANKKEFQSLKVEFDNLNKKYNLLVSQNDKLMNDNNQLNSMKVNFSKAIMQALNQFNSGIIPSNYLSETNLITKYQSLPHNEPSINSYPDLDQSENSIFLDLKRGTPNIGNTCYLNSILQIFASNNNLYRIITQKKDNLSIALSKVLSIIRMGSLESSLNSLKSKIDAEFPSFLDFEQQDSKELLVALLGIILDDTKKSLFSFRFHDILSCSECLAKSSMVREENLIVVPRSVTSIASFFNEIKNPKEIQGLGLKCENCSKNSIFKTEIVEIEYPTNLIFYLPESKKGKRFDNFLEETLELKGRRYNLYGVVCYYRCGNGGHYTAFTKSKDGWVEYNDQIVKLKNFDRNETYLAFYSVFL